MALVLGRGREHFTAALNLAWSSQWRLCAKAFVVSPEERKAVAGEEAVYIAVTAQIITTM